MPLRHFKSKEGYRKYRAYRHIHGIKSRSKEVVVAGKKHKIDHSKHGRKKRGAKR